MLNSIILGIMTIDFYCNYIVYKLIPCNEHSYKLAPYTITQSCPPSLAETIP